MISYWSQPQDISVARHTCLRMFGEARVSVGLRMKSVLFDGAQLVNGFQLGRDQMS